MSDNVGWTKAEFDAAPQMAQRLHTRILDLQDALEESEFCRDSLRLERDGLEFIRRKDNESLIGQRDAYRALLERLVDAADANAPIEDLEWMEALYAARNALRDDPANETDGDEAV